MAGVVDEVVKVELTYEAVKECWICHRNEQQVRDIYDFEVEGEPFWHEVHRNWDHELCPVCYDIIAGLAADVASELDDTLMIVH